MKTRRAQGWTNSHETSTIPYTVNLAMKLQSSANGCSDDLARICCPSVARFVRHLHKTARLMAVPKSGKERPGKADEISAKGTVKAEEGDGLELDNPWVELADSWNQIRYSLPLFSTGLTYKVGLRSSP